jgi:hypothetical protein
MTRFFLAWFLIFTFQSLARAKSVSSDPVPAVAPIQTHWTTWGGMQYFQNDQLLSGPELKNLIASLKDQEATNLLLKSESDETIGYVGLGSSIFLSILVIFLPNNHIHVVGLDISTPYLPVAIPGTLMGIAGGLLETEAGTAKYAAIQRYNRLTKQPVSVTWNLYPRKNGMGLNLGCVF